MYLEKLSLLLETLQLSYYAIKIHLTDLQLKMFLVSSSDFAFTSKVSELLICNCSIL